MGGTVMAAVGLGALSLTYPLPEPDVEQRNASSASQPTISAQGAPDAIVPDGSQETDAPTSSHADPAVDLSEADEPILLKENDITAGDPQKPLGAGLQGESAVNDAPALPEAPSADASVTEKPALESNGLAQADTPKSEKDDQATSESATSGAEPRKQVENAWVETERAVEPLPDAERDEITLLVPEGSTASPQQRPTVSEVDDRDTGALLDRPSIGTPARTLSSSQSDRLPSLDGQGETNGDGAGRTASAGQVNLSDLPPVERFAEPFAAQGDAPLMAIVLIDDGTSDIGVEALSTFPYPLSFAVDTSWEGATDAMAKYRALGFEVLAMVNLPRGARAQDVEVSLPLLMEKLPEAVAVMETPDAGLQGSRDAAAQVTEITKETGHGLLFFPKGLNTAQKLASKEGVPSATVFRDFDGKGQNARSVKRFLSHAALKAGSEGGVVMVGRLRADTISALLLWGLADRAQQLQLAPVSQLLRTTP